MRKFLSMLLVLTLMFALAVPAFADAPSHPNAHTAKTTGPAWDNGASDTFDAYAQVTRSSATLENVTKVYKVQIEWSVGEVTGTYTNAYEWVPEDFAAQSPTAPHYKQTGTTVVPVAGNVNVTVKNRSNDKVNATLTFESVKDGENAVSAFTYTNNKIEVENAAVSCTDDGTDAGLTGIEKSNSITGTVNLTTEGKAWTEFGTTANYEKCVMIGTFTVTVAAGALPTPTT